MKKLFIISFLLFAGSYGFGQIQKIHPDSIEIVDSSLLKVFGLGHYEKELNNVNLTLDTVQAENLELIVLENDWENARMFVIGDTIPFSGFMASFYPITKKIESLVQYKNGKTNNCWSKSYYENGQIMKEFWYGNQMGTEHGKHTTWFENGNIKTTGQFINGKKNGEWITYSQDGKKETIQNYVDGKEQN